MYNKTFKRKNLLNMYSEKSNLHKKKTAIVKIVFLLITMFIFYIYY